MKELSIYSNGYHCTWN